MAGINGIIMVILFVTLILIRVPVGHSMGMASMFYLLFLSNVPLLIEGQRMIKSLESFPILAVPLYILAADLMNQSKITDRLFDFAKHLIGFIPGGLGHVNVLASMIFAGMSGSALADAAGLGRIEIKAMLEDGYDPQFSAAITAASCTIGPVIPPSILMILYGIVAEESVAKLFVAGAIPGVLMGVSLMILVYFIAKKRNYPRSQWLGIGRLWSSFVKAFPPLMTPVIIMGGIIGGIFTPTEAAVVVVFYAFFLGLIYRDLSLRDTYENLKRSGINTGVILWIFTNAAIFSYILTIENLPQMAVQWMSSVTAETWVVLLILNIFLLIAGCFLDPTPLLSITAPVIIPILHTFHIKVIHFGVVMVLNVLIGLLTPPVGLALYVVIDIAKISFSDVCKAIWPFYIPLIIVLLLITYIPELTLFLPNLLLK